MQRFFAPTMIRAYVMSGDSDNTYRVGVVCREPFEDMWEALWHVRGDLTLDQANWLRTRVEERRQLDLDYWRWHPSRAAQYQFMHPS